jgi:hypothetical protein
MLGHLSLSNPGPANQAGGKYLLSPPFFKLLFDIFGVLSGKR